MDIVSQKLFESLDLNQIIVPDHQELLMQPLYHNMQEELMSNGDHLEHMHAYYSPDQKLYKSDGEPLATMDFHVDSGLVIAMTTG